MRLAPRWCTRFEPSYSHSGDIALFKWGVRRSTRPVLYNGWMDCLDTWCTYLCIYDEPIYRLPSYYTAYSGTGIQFFHFRARMLLGSQLHIHMIPGCGILYSNKCYMYNPLSTIKMCIYDIFTPLWDYQSPLVLAVQHTNMGRYG